MTRWLAVAVAVILFALLFAVPIRENILPSDADRFAAWRSGADRADVVAIDAYLAREGVDGIVPLADILRGDARWRLCPAVKPFAVPPRRLWPAIVPTLRYVREEVIPAVGPVRVVSGYRDPVANLCFKGAKASRHLQFAALDLEPARGLGRGALIAKLCPLQARTGAAKHVGLGIYAGTRFHIDTAGFRRWGGDYHAASSPCR